ncbi:MAG: TolC family protein [Planctomycetota bacterium]|jgi:outer membrane protein TolC
MSTLWKALFWISLVGLLVSCTAVENPAPQPKGSEAVPQKGGKPLQGQPTDPWWTEFQDAVLDGLVREVLRNNRDLGEAAPKVLSVLALDPATETGTIPQRLGWEREFWGEILAKHNASQGLEEMGSAERETARFSLSVQTVKATFAVAENRRQLELARTLVMNCQDTLQEAQRNIHGKGGSPREIESASEGLSHANGLYRFQRERLDRAIRRLEILLGRYPGHASSLPGFLPMVPEAIGTGHGEGRCLDAEKVLKSREEKLNHTLRRAADARRKAEDLVRTTGKDRFALLRAKRMEIDAQSQWLTVHRKRLDHRVNHHLALGGEVYRAPRRPERTEDFGESQPERFALMDTDAPHSQGRS